MDHDAVVAAEGVKDVGHGEFDLRHFVRFEGLRFFEAVSEFAAENVGANELLIATHGEV